MANDKNQRPAGSATAAKPVRMYPSNSLPAQVRAPSDNLSAFTVLQDAFGAKK